jgi:large subunit ribosomal protein L31
MKESIHPVYREVVFRDMSTGFAFLSRSAIETGDKTKWEDGNEYPLVNLEITSDSHPFYTGQHRFIDAEGRVERFMKRYQKKDAPKKK